MTTATSQKIQILTFVSVVTLDGRIVSRDDNAKRAYAIPCFFGDDLEETVTLANGKATKRTLPAEWAANKAHDIYALWVERCAALGLPLTSIRVEITGGEKLANAYAYSADMTSLSWTGAAWEARRVYNKPQSRYGYGHARIEGGAAEAKTWKIKAAALGLTIRKDGADLIAYKG